MGFKIFPNISQFWQHTLSSKPPEKTEAWKTGIFEYEGRLLNGAQVFSELKGRRPDDINQLYIDRKLVRYYTTSEDDMKGLKAALEASYQNIDPNFPKPQPS